MNVAPAPVSDSTPHSSGPAMPIRTRDSIRAFVASFPGVRVDIATATPDTIEVYGGTAFLWGSYFERLAFPGQPVSEQLFRVPIPSLKSPAPAVP